MCIYVYIYIYETSFRDEYKPAHIAGGPMDFLDKFLGWSGHQRRELFQLLGKIGLAGETRREFWDESLCDETHSYFVNHSESSTSNIV